MIESLLTLAPSCTSAFGTLPIFQYKYTGTICHCHIRLQCLSMRSCQLITLVVQGFAVLVALQKNAHWLTGSLNCSLEQLHWNITISWSYSNIKIVLFKLYHKRFGHGICQLLSSSWICGLAWAQDIYKSQQYIVSNKRPTAPESAKMLGSKS